MELRYPSPFPLLPERRAALEKFCNSLEKAFEKTLVSLILYGGLASGRYKPHISDVNLLVVAGEIRGAHLKAIEEDAAEARSDFRLALFLQTRRELSHSARLFPLKFLEIRRHHHVLWGDPVLDPLEIRRDDLLLNCRMEARNLASRVRLGYLLNAPWPQRLEQAVSSAYTSMMTILWGVLNLEDPGRDLTRVELVDWAGGHAGLDVEPIHQVRGLRDDTLSPHPDEPAFIRELYLRLADETGKLADFLDQLTLH